MNLWLRLIRVWLTGRRRTRLTVDGESVIRVRVWPHDLDIWGHVNGGRYLTLSDLGRLDFTVRTGLFAVVRRHRWTMPMGPQHCVSVDRFVSSTPASYTPASWVGTTSGATWRPGSSATTARSPLW